MEVPHKINWTIASHKNDWMSTQGQPIVGAINALQQHGVCEFISWSKTSRQRKVKQYKQPIDIVDLLAEIINPRKTLVLDFGGGTAESTWYGTVVIFPFNNAMEESEGINLANIYLSGDKLDSDDLFESFKMFSENQEIDYSSIHPVDHASDLVDITKDGPYEDALILGPTFRGVYWAKFISEYYLKFFDQHQLKLLKRPKFEFLSPGKCIFRGYSDLLEAEQTTNTQSIIEQTEALRSILL